MVIFIKYELFNVIYGIGVLEFDDEGCVIIFEYVDYYVLMCYIFNLGGELKCFDYW